MRGGQLARDAAEVLDRDAVQFSSDLRYNDQKAFPFWYSLIPYPDFDFDSLNNGLGLLGHTVAPGGVIDIPINLQRDAAYRLLNAKYSPFRYAPGGGLTGTITTAAGNAAIVGVGTAFTTELVVGQPIIWLSAISRLYESGVVAIITNDTNLTLETAALTLSAGIPVFRRLNKWYDTVPNTQNAAYADLTGTITVAAGGAAMAGAGTAFVAEVNVGDVLQAIDGAGITRNFQVTVVTDNTNIVISETLGAADAGVAGAAFQLIAEVLAAGGTAAVTAVNNFILGAATTFTADVTEGDLLYFPTAAGVVQRVFADAVIDNTHIKFTGPSADSGAGVDVAIGVHSADRAAVPRNLGNVYQPLTAFIRVTLIAVSLRSRYLYGGLQEYGPSGRRANETGGLQERRLLIKTLQGINDGMGMVRIESLLPYEGRLLIRVENLYSEPVIINGNLFGYKIVIEE